MRMRQARPSMPKCLWGMLGKKSFNEEAGMGTDWQGVMWYHKDFLPLYVIPERLSKVLTNTLFDGKSGSLAGHKITAIFSLSSDKEQSFCYIWTFHHPCVSFWYRSQSKHIKLIGTARHCGNFLHLNYVVITTKASVWDVNCEMSIINITHTCGQATQKLMD